MRKLLAIACTIPLFAACTVGDDPIVGDEHPDPIPDPTPDPNPGITGTISTDTTWSGAVRFKDETIIPAGVTVTVAAGTVMSMANSARFTVAGTLKFEGTSAEKVTAQFEDGAQYWGPISVSGTLDLKYANITGGAISTNGTAANLVIADSKMYKAGGDYIIMNGGSINMMYSQIGPAAGETDTTHCNFHINSATTISVLRSNINGAPYGLMFYGGVGANFQYNNWYGNSSKDVDTASGVDGNFSFGWFERGTVTGGPGSVITADNLSATQIVDAGPRP